MTSIIYLAFVAIAPLVTARLAPARAVWLVYFAGLMLLPPLVYGDVSRVETADWRIIGQALPSDTSAGNALVAAFAALVVAILRDGRLLLGWRPGLVDVPLAVFCLWPMAQDWLLPAAPDPAGTTGAAWLAVAWGIPWVLGRLYLTDADGRRDFGRMLVAVALVLLPLAYVETISEWRLHEAIFGPHPFSYDGHRRYFGFRPLVLFENGNQYGIYICLAALFAFGGALAQPRFARTAGPVVAAIVLAVTALASQSVGAIVLAGGGALALVTAARWRAGRIAAIGLVAAAALPLAAYSVGLVPVRQIAESTGIAAPAKALFEASGRGSLGWRASQNDRTAELQREGLPLGNGAWDWFAPAETRPWGLWSLMAGQYGLVPLAALALAVMCGWARRERTGRPEDATTLRMFRIGTLIVIADATLNSFIFYPLSAMMASCAPQTRRPKPAKAASGEDHPSAGSHMAGAVDGDGERQEKSWKHSGTGSRSSPSAG